MGTSLSSQECYKIVNNLVGVNCERLFEFAEPVSIHTRGHSKTLCKPLCNAAYIAGTSLSSYIINVWNSLPDNIVQVASPPVCTLAKRLKSVDIVKLAVKF